jgi:hypothetical protein
MRLLLHSHTYFFASCALHASIVLFLIFGSIHFGSKIESFEATIEFVSPKTQKRLETPAKSQIKQEESVSTFQNDVPTLSSKSLDELIRSKGLRLTAENNLNNRIDKKQSDLLGYLRANEMTQESTKKNPGKTQVKPTLKPITSRQSPSANTSPKQIGKTQQNVTASSLEKTDQTTDDAGQLTAARRIWEKKKKDTSYKQTLKKLVTANWTVPIYNKKDFVILIEAIIDANGNLVKLELSQGSGLPIIDAAAEKAIRVSTPFPKLPKILQEDKPEFKAVFRFTPDSAVQ